MEFKKKTRSRRIPRSMAGVWKLVSLRDQVKELRNVTNDEPVTQVPFMLSVQQTSGQYGTTTAFKEVERAMARIPRYLVKESAFERLQAAVTRSNEAFTAVRYHSPLTAAEKAMEDLPLHLELPESLMENLSKKYGVKILPRSEPVRPVTLPLSEPGSKRVVISAAKRVMETHLDVIKALANR
jgi:hypothetical protein